MKRWILALLVMLAASPGWSDPTLSGPNYTDKTVSFTWRFDASTAPTPIMSVIGKCKATFIRGGTDSITLYQNTTASTSGGTQVGSAFAATTTDLTPLSIGQPYIYAVSDGASGGSSLTIVCSPTFGGGEGWTDVGAAIVADAGNDVFIGGDQDATCESGEICLGQSSDGIVYAEGFVARDQASGSNFDEFDDNPTTLPSAPSGANVRLFTAADGELRKLDASDNANGVTLLTADNMIDQMRKRPFYFSDFLGIVSGSSGDTLEPHVSPWNFLANNSGTIAAVTTASDDHPGIITIRHAATTANSGGGFIASTVAEILGGGEIFELVFQHKVASGTDTQIQFGFHDTGNIGAPVDAAAIDIAEDTLTPKCRTCAASTCTDSSSIGTLTVDTWYRARVTVNADASQVTCSIWDASGTLVGTQSNTTNIPTAVSGSGIVAHDSNATDGLIELVWIDYMAMGFTEDRELTR